MRESLSRLHLYIQDFCIWYLPKSEQLLFTQFYESRWGSAAEWSMSGLLPSLLCSTLFPKTILVSRTRGSVCYSSSRSGWSNFRSSLNGRCSSFLQSYQGYKRTLKVDFNAWCLNSSPIPLLSHNAVVTFSLLSAFVQRHMLHRLRFDLLPSLSTFSLTISFSSYFLMLQFELGKPQISPQLLHEEQIGSLHILFDHKRILRWYKSSDIALPKIEAFSRP